MPFEQDIVAGANQFTGLAGAGLFTFAAFANFEGDMYRPRVLSLWVSLGGAAATIQIFRAFNGTPAAERQLLAEGVGNSLGFLCSFEIPVNVTPMEILIVTTGKTAQGRAELDWTAARFDTG